MLAFKGKQTRTKTNFAFYSKADAPCQQLRAFRDEGGCGPLCTQRKPPKVSPRSVLQKMLLKITAPCNCFLRRRASPSNASGSFCHMRSWIRTASSDGPSKTVCGRVSPSEPGWPPTTGLGFGSAQQLICEALGSRIPADCDGLSGLILHLPGGAFLLRDSFWAMPLLNPWAPTLIPFWQMDIMFLKAEQGRWRPTNLPHLLAVCTWAGHITALSLSFPIGIMGMKVSFFGKGLCTFIYFIAY